MRNFHLALVAGASLLLALAGTANAHSGGGGGLGGGSGGGAPSSPPGFNSSGGHNGFELLTTSGESSTQPEPKGWDQGKADWKTDLPETGTTSPSVDPLPPGLSKN